MMNLDEMEALEKKATPGPWTYELSLDDEDELETDSSWSVEAQMSETNHVTLIPWQESNHGNGRFIAASREFVPSAIDEIRRLRIANELINKGYNLLLDEVDRLKEENKKLRKAWDWRKNDTD